MIRAYDESTLELNAYTDLWSYFTVSSSQSYDGDDMVLEVTYKFEISNKDGKSNDRVKQESVEAQQACENLVEDMFVDGRLTSTMTIKEKAHVLYQWIAENVSYAYDAPGPESVEIKPDNFYDAMIVRSAVCQGITGAYVELCRAAEVPMYVQLGYTSGVPHSWCKIEVDGVYQYIDPTWGITDVGEGEQYSEKWFWVTQEFMETYEGNEREFTKFL